MSTANDIALALTSRVETINGADGYETTIGVRVYRGRRRLDESCIPCTVIIESDDQVLEQTRGREAAQVKLGQRYILEGHDACDPDHPNDTAQKIIADLKRAIFKAGWYDPTFIRNIRYIGRTISPREDGTAIVAAAIEVEIEFVESLTAP